MIRYYKIIINLLAIILIGIINLSLVNALPQPFNHLNLSLVVMIFILVFAGFERSIWWAVGIGFLTEIFSFMPFGAAISAYFLSIIIASFLLDNFFTNRSLYSILALVLFATLSYVIISTSITWAYDLIIKSDSGNPFNFLFGSALIYKSFLNLGLAIVLFYIIHNVSDRLKPFFLVRIK